MIRHHPAEASLIACAAGTMPMAHAQVIGVACRALPGLRRRPARRRGCRRRAAGRTAAGADGAPTRSPARWRGWTRPPPNLRARAPAFDLAALASGRWRRVAPGIAIMKLLPRDATDSRLDLIRVAPGRALLSHGHTGRETTCVLSGAFADGTGTFAAGDCVEADAALDHTPRALPGEDCVCLIATTHHLRPHGWLGRLVRPLLGM